MDIDVRRGAPHWLVSMDQLADPKGRLEFCKDKWLCDICMHTKLTEGQALNRHQALAEGGNCMSTQSHGGGGGGGVRSPPTPSFERSGAGDGQNCTQE